MKTASAFFARAALAGLVLGCAGCLTHKTITPIGGGYREVAHLKPAYFDEPELPRTSLEYLAPDGKTILVWPALYGAEDLAHGGLAIFVGDKAYREPERVTHPRLFAVQAPALPVDITDEVLWRWSKINGRKFNVALEKFNTVVPVEKNGRLELRLEFWSDNKLLAEEKQWPDHGDLALEWGQVAEIMRAVKTRGAEQKDLRWHTRYLGEKF